VIDSFLITCEHGGNRIPAPYRRLFRGRRALLDSHRGYDPGALAMARAMARAFRAPLVTSTISRLLIDLNRSIGHPHLFSVAPREDRRKALPALSLASRASSPAIGVARPARDPHFVAQFHSGVGRQGATCRRGFALSPCSARGDRAVRSLEGIARGIRSRAPSTPQLPLCWQRRRAGLALAPALPARRLRRD
jgi:N-formylglutamate amidohydrolase